VKTKRKRQDQKAIADLIFLLDHSPAFQSALLRDHLADLAALYRQTAAASAVAAWERAVDYHSGPVLVGKKAKGKNEKAAGD